MSDEKHRYREEKSEVIDVSIPEVATAKQLAEYLGTTEASLAQDRYLGRGVPYTRVGRRIRYLRSDVHAFLAANRIGGDAA